MVSVVHMGEEKGCIGSWWRNWRERDWIGLAQDRYRWQMLVSAVMNLRVP